MASIVTIKIKYDDNSKSLTESFNCADTNPSPQIIKSLEDQMRYKWQAMGGSWRDMQVHTTVRQA
jgi:hypothetical protein